MKKVAIGICMIILLFTSCRVFATNTDDFVGQYGVTYYSLDGTVIKTFIGYPGQKYTVPEESLFFIEDRNFVCFSSDIDSIQEKNINIYPKYDYYKLTINIFWIGQPKMMQDDFESVFELCDYNIYSNESDAPGDILIDSNRLNEIIMMDEVLIYCRKYGALSFKTNIKKGSIINSDKNLTVYVQPYNFKITYSTYLDGELSSTTEESSIVVNSEIEYIPEEIEGYSYIERLPSTETYDLSVFPDLSGRIGPYDYKLYYETTNIIKYFIEIYNGTELIRSFNIEKGELISEEYLELSQYNLEHYSCIGFDRDLTVPVEANMIINLEYEPNDCNVNFYYDETTMIESSVQKYYEDVIYPVEDEFNIDNIYPAFLAWPLNEKVTENMKIYALLDEDIYYKDKLYEVNIYQTLIDGETEETSLIETQQVKRKEDVVLKKESIDGFVFDKVMGNVENITENSDIYLIYSKVCGDVKLSITLPNNPYNVYNGGENIIFSISKDETLTESELNKHLIKEEGISELILVEGALGRKYSMDTIIGHYDNKNYKGQFYAYKTGNYFNLTKLLYYEIIKDNDILKPSDYNVYRFVGFDKPFSKMICDMKYYAIYIDDENEFYIVDELGENLTRIDIANYPNIDLVGSTISYTPISNSRKFPIIKEIEIRDKSPLEIKIIFNGNVDFNKYSIKSVSYGGAEYSNFTDYQFDNKSLLDRKSDWIKITVNVEYKPNSSLDYLIIQEN